MSQQGLRRRVQELASDLHKYAEANANQRVHDGVADLRALLAAHKQAKRELAIWRGIERRLRRENAVMRKALRELRLHPWKVCGELDGIEKKGITL
jgi:hypothetical protein